MAAALAADDFETAQKEVVELSAFSFEGKFAHSAKAMASAVDMDALRKSFELFSEELIKARSSFESKVTVPLFAFHCSMTGGTGNWIQTDSTLANPFHGAKMLRCGTKI